MNKTIMFLGMLAVSFANAQQEGRVGINADAPKATLEVQPTTTNLTGTTNEGIVAPKLSKTRVAAIATPVEGTLVYVTDNAYTAGSDNTVNNRVAKIDEKGYYYFDGAEWIKAKNVAQDQEWVYDDATKRINLRRSGDATGTFKNKIFYDVTTGQFIDTDTEDNIKGIRFVNNSGNLSFEETKETLADIKFKNYTYTESGNLQVSGNVKKIEGRELIVTETDTTPSFYSVQSSITVPPNNANNYTAVYASAANATLFGTGAITASLGQSGQVSIGNSQSVKGYITGFLGTSAVNTSGSIGEVYGILGRNFFYSPIGAKVGRSAGGYFSNGMPLNDNSLIQEFMGVYTNVSNNSQNVGTGKYLAGIYSIANQVGKTKYSNLYGIYTSSSIAANATAPDNHYGLYIHRIAGAEKTNYGIYVDNVSEVKVPNGKITDYALYTKIGKVRIGDYTMVKTDVIAPKSSLTANGHISAGFNDIYSHRAIFIGASTEAGFGGGTFVGFGTYKDDTAGVYKFKTSKDNDSKNKNRFLIFNDNKNGKVYFSAFTANDGKIEQEFTPDTESTLTVIHEGKKVGIGTNTPNEKLEVVGAVKIGTTNSTCTTANAGTIRFDAGTKKFQGCTGSEWKDLHN